MDGLHAELSRRLEAGKLLGYLNFSDGRPDPKFRRALAEAFTVLTDHGDKTPWLTIGAWLTASGESLAAGGSAAFKDLSQANSALSAAFDHLPADYRIHHADLLAHQPDAFLFGPFFLARCCEACLAARAEDSARTPEMIAKAALEIVNDYVGYRPIALLETRPQTEFYGHERVAPVPVLFAGAGVAPGPYADLIRPALELLDKTDSATREEACWDIAKLDEMAIDPRAADHFHPVNKRPNVLFGEWDPHRIDNRGYYRRFILKQPTLDALLKWASRDNERLFESAAVLAGTILMGAGVSGSGPTHYDSSVTLSTLVQKIARYRDSFYKELLDKLPGSHGERLRNESRKLKQPFAGVRQFLNQAIAAERALHLQERRLALLFAAMGYPHAARDRAHQIPAPSVRFSCEIRLRQTEADFANKAGDPRRAARVLSEAEEFLTRGIDCGAIIDPWNILGYQGLFPIFPGRDDTVRDPRAEEIIYTVGRQFDRYAHALAASVTANENGLTEQLRLSMAKLSEWWDRFATSTVNDLPHVNGGERATAAEHVSQALAIWKQASGNARDVRFWQQHREGFRTPAAFAQVIDALFDAGDFKASLALLITWLSETSADLPLQDPAASFPRLASRWLSGLLDTQVVPPEEKPPLLRRFFELLESNAEDLWHVPSVPTSGGYRNRDDEDDDEDDDDTFSSAYEGMSYRDSTDDGNEGSIMDGEPGGIPGEFPLENDSERFEERLRFLTLVGRLWRTAARSDLWPASQAATIGAWLEAARANLHELEDLIAAIAGVEVPPPSNGLDGVVEFDRRRMLKGHLLDVAVACAVEMHAATRRLNAALSRTAELPEDDGLETGTLWETFAIRLERAVGLGDAVAARNFLQAFIPHFRHEPLLTHPPADGGEPRAALRAQNALQLVESLLARLPKLGLLRETFQLTKLARQMERNDPPEGRRISSFDQLFRTAVVETVQALVTSAREWKSQTPFTAALRHIADAYHRMWLDHSQSLRLSALEAVLDDNDWGDLRKFIRTYGGDLFTVRFLTLSNIRGILGQGVHAWLDSQADPDQQSPTEEPPKLVQAWADGNLERGKTVRLFEIVLQALVEYYDEYRDYNTTTTQSDYGENLHILLDFLRLKASYDRIAWRLKPLVLAHEVLCRESLDAPAAEWREFIASKTTTIADELLAKLSAREAEHGMKLRTVRDRLEERFTSPLQIDQAAAHVASAATMARAHATDGSVPEHDPSFQAFLAAIAPLAATPVGVGLDVPNWLRRLEDELRRTRSGSDDDVGHYVPVAGLLSVSDVKRQLGEWDRPLSD